MLQPFPGDVRPPIDGCSGEVVEPELDGVNIVVDFPPLVRERRRWRVLWDKKPPVWLARVVAPSSHPYERGVGERRHFFVVRERPQWSKPTAPQAAR